MPDTARKLNELLGSKVVKKGEPLFPRIDRLK